MFFYLSDLICENATVNVKTAARLKSIVLWGNERWMGKNYRSDQVILSVEVSFHTAIRETHSIIIPKAETAAKQQLENVIKAGF